jgi:hypothetical protein
MFRILLQSVATHGHGASLIYNQYGLVVKKTISGGTTWAKQGPSGNLLCILKERVRACMKFATDLLCSSFCEFRGRNEANSTVAPVLCHL